MTDRREEIIRQLKQNGDDTVVFFRSLSKNQLDLVVYDDEPGWTPRQVLAHLVTIEKSMHWVFQNILEGGPGSPENFDIDRFNRTQPRKLDGLPLEEVIRRFRVVRDETVRIVARMEEEDLGREGRHAFHGPGKLERFIHWAHEHAAIHLDDIRKVMVTDRP